MTAKVITDGFEDRAVHAPRVVSPGERTFADRAERFSTLAAQGAQGDFLRLMATVARAQQAALEAGVAAEVPAEALGRARDFGMPPLTASSHARGAQWRSDLSAIVDFVVREASGAPVRVAAQGLLALDAPGQEALADRLLASGATEEDAAMVPFVGAALQVYFTRLARTLDPADLEACDVQTLCPACGSRPVASVVRVGGERSGMRYLICSLCATESHLARIKCSFCEEDRSLKYFSLDGPGKRDAWRAETCEECKTYLKIFYQERDPQLDPFADDLASLALDILVDEAEYLRSGPNLLFHPGTG